MENEVQNQSIETKDVSDGKFQTFNLLIATLLKNKKVFMALVALLFLVVVSILFGALYSQKLKTTKTTKNEKPKQEFYGSVLFTPANIIATPGKESKVDIIINTDAKKISGVILSIKYNPKILEKVSIVPFQDRNSALGYSLKPIDGNFTDPPGSVITTLKLPDGMQDLAGSGKIAEVHFTVKPLNVAILSTNIELTQLTGFISSTQGEHTNLSKNQVVITLPAGLKNLSPTQAMQK